MKKLLFGLSIIALVMSAGAQAPEMFRYQGRVVDGANLVNATLPMSFKLYDAQSAGSLLYEDSSSVLVVDGLYATYIGDNTVSGSLVDALTHPAVYLELTIDGETLSPREQIVSVPYAMNATPSGTIVLSETYPNPELEAQGYSLYYEDVTQAGWEKVEFPSMQVMSAFNFGYGNHLGVLVDEGMGESTVYLTENGIFWDEKTCPIGFDSMYGPEIIEYNNTLFFFGETESCSTTDLETWNTWTNSFSTNEMESFYIDEIEVFNDALWAFIHDMSSSNQVMRSTDGTNWTKMSDVPWASDMPGAGFDVIASPETLWVDATDSITYSNHIWSSTDGISWSKSATTTPGSSMSSRELLCHDNALWGFVIDMMDGNTCWKSLDNGNNWALVSTNLPAYSDGGMGGPEVISHENKLWFCSGDGLMVGTVLWSTNAVDWNGSLSASVHELISLPNGRLWGYEAANWQSGIQFRYIGGPKVDDGLYYYRKD